MECMTSTQQSHVRPQNPYNKHPHHDPHNATPANQNKSKRNIIPPKLTLYDWIKLKITNNHNKDHNHNITDTTNNHRTMTSDKPTNTTATRWQHHQQQINLTHTNDQWGDDLSLSPAIFSIASKNINTLSPEDNLLQWQGIAHAMQTYKINSLSIQEPNTKWTNHLQQWVQCIFQQTFNWSALSTSNSTEPSGTYQPGGTALNIVGPHASWLISSRQDTSSMGWWSYIELLGKHNKHLIITLVYCIHSQAAHIGSNTVSTQQTQILLHSGQHCPRPQHQLINNLPNWPNPTVATYRPWNSCVPRCQWGYSQS